MARSGELTIDVEGQVYRLVLDINALIAAEDQSKQSFQVLLKGVAEMRLGAIRTLCWAALQKHHPALSLEDVGDWMQRVGIDRLISSFAALAPSTEPDSDDVKDAGVKSRPRKARAVKPAA